MIKPEFNYVFTPLERGFFERAMQTFNSTVAAGIQMICTQQELAGQWRLKMDGSGIERADLPPALNPVSLPDPAADIKPNGMAS